MDWVQKVIAVAKINRPTGVHYIEEATDSIWIEITLKLKFVFIIAWY